MNIAEKILTWVGKKQNPWAGEIKASTLLRYAKRKHMWTAQWWEPDIWQKKKTLFTCIAVDDAVWDLLEGVHPTSNGKGIYINMKGKMVDVDAVEEAKQRALHAIKEALAELGYGAAVHRNFSFSQDDWGQTTPAIQHKRCKWVNGIINKLEAEGD